MVKKVSNLKNLKGQIDKTVRVNWPTNSTQIQLRMPLNNKGKGQVSFRT